MSSTTLLFPLTGRITSSSSSCSGISILLDLPALKSLPTEVAFNLARKGLIKSDTKVVLATEDITVYIEPTEQSRENFDVLRGKKVGSSVRILGEVEVDYDYMEGMGVVFVKRVSLV